MERLWALKAESFDAHPFIAFGSYDAAYEVFRRMHPDGDADESRYIACVPAFESCAALDGAEGDEG